MTGCGVARTGASRACAPAAAAVLAVGGAAGCRSTGNGVLVGAGGVDVAANASPAFAAGVTPTMAPPVAVGTPVGFRMSSSEWGFGHLYLVGADGGVTMLAENLPVAAGAQVAYPRAADGLVIRASLPAGIDRVVFLVTRQPFAGFADNQGSTLTRPMVLASTAETFLRRLNRANAADAGVVVGGGRDPGAGGRVAVGRKPGSGRRRAWPEGDKETR